MGSFAGHVVPGSCFLLLSLCWCFAIYRNYFKAKCNGTPYRSTTWFKLDDYPNFPLESLVKLLLVVVGIMGETVTGSDDNGVFVHVNNGQHITMFFFFGIQALAEILQFYNYPAIPTNIEYFTSILGFFAEALLFCFHLHGRSQMDVLVHRLLIVAISSCCIMMVVETFVRSKVMVTLARAYWVMVQGTWFYHVAFILFPPFDGMRRWSPDDHREMMLITMYFTWHCAVDFCIVLLIGSLVSLRYRRDLAMCREKRVMRRDCLVKNMNKNEFTPLSQFESDSDAI